MKKTLLILCVCTAFLPALAQLNHSRVYSTFDNYPLEKTDTFYNGEDRTGGFTHFQRFFSNQYDTLWGSWEGWSISNMGDDSTRGFSNQYSAISGTGVSGTANYVVAYSTPTIVFDEATLVSGAYFTNNSYAYYDMLEGSNFSKKFGGMDGNDPDFFLLKVYCYLDGVVQDSSELYLADYRFTDNSEDYILKDWSYMAFSAEEAEVLCDSISFIFSSSDNGAWGMNTPAFFCMDDFNAINILNYSQNISLAYSDTFFNGSDMSGGFLHHYLFFPNNYNEDWHSWDGWSVSNKYDNLSSGFQNQYSAMATGPDFHMLSYGVTNEIRGPYLSGQDKNYIFKTRADAPWPITIGITNSAYTFYDMQEGSNFSKKFGGTDGNDPDFFRVLIDYVDAKDSLLRTDTIYLADFRFTDNSKDFILDQWEYLEINEDPWSMQTRAHKIKFRLESSDNGSWGMNTPAYFCLTLDFNFGSSKKLEKEQIGFKLYPNPSANYINIETDEEVLSVEVIDMQAKLQIESKSTQLDVSELQSGMYIIKLKTINGTATKRFIKL